MKTKSLKIQPVSKLRGIVRLPGDKSISHRAAICASLARGKTHIKNFQFSNDCLVTLRALQALGAKVKRERGSDSVTVVSSGKLRRPSSSLMMGESGTSARILLGVLAGQTFKSQLVGAPSLSRRPMARVVEPLRLMGAQITSQSRNKDEFLPLDVLPSALHGISWTQKIPSAQVKSAILLAGLYARGQTIVYEPVGSRDHTEKMLKLFGGKIRVKKNRISISSGALKTPAKIFIPGDISSAAFFIGAALLIKGSSILIRDVGINPTRMGAVRVFKRMGGKINVLNKKRAIEPYADIEVSASPLKATVIENGEIPALIDELPILMVAASLAKGRTLIKGAQELRVKETDRIHSMCHNLTKLGVNIKVKSLKNKETIEILGSKALKGAQLKSFNDHRSAMSMCVAGLMCEGACCLDDISCINKSFPNFLLKLRHLFVK